MDLLNTEEALNEAVAERLPAIAESAAEFATACLGRRFSRSDVEIRITFTRAPVWEIVVASHVGQGRTIGDALRRLTTALSRYARRVAA